MDETPKREHWAKLFAQELREIRAELNLTNSDIAYGAGVSINTTNRWTAYEGPQIPEENFPRLCQYLETVRPGTGLRLARAVGPYGRAGLNTLTNAADLAPIGRADNVVGELFGENAQEASRAPRRDGDEPTIDVKKLAQLRERYLQFLVNRYEWIDAGQGIRQLRSIVRMRLEDLYTRISLTSPMGKHSDSNAGPEERLPLAYDALKLVGKEARLVVLGDPGSGKTTLLKRIALSLAKGNAQSEMGLNGEWLPILLPIAAYTNALEHDSDLSLVRYLDKYYDRLDMRGLAPLFEHAFHSGQAFLLIDGLDEPMSPERRELAVQRLDVVFTVYPQSRGVITSRSTGYWDTPLESFPHATFLPLSDDDILRFSKNWYVAYESAGQEQSIIDPNLVRRATVYAEGLLAEIKADPKIHSLARNPLLLTWLLVIFQQESRRLPDRREELYRLYIEGLAENWIRSRSLSGPLPNVWSRLTLNARWLVKALAPVALNMVENEQRIIDEYQLLNLIQEQVPQKDVTLAEEFLFGVQQITGIIQERAPHQYSFLHPTLMEYLAARAITDLPLPLGQTPWEIIQPHLSEPHWQEVIRLAVAASTSRDATAMIQALIDHIQEPNLRGQGHVYSLLGNCLVDAGQELFPPDIWTSAIGILSTGIMNHVLAPRVRCEIATVLGYLGEDEREFDDWVCIPEDDYSISNADASDDGSEKIVPHIREFRMSKYPTTNAQFRCFIDAGGYLERAYWNWSNAAWSYIRSNMLVSPALWSEAQFKPNHPVVWITWFEARAYCEWLTHELRRKGIISATDVVRLPFEEEWEVAAGWDPNTKSLREWPSGNEFDPTLANTSESGIGGTSPVGLFMRGTSPFGLHDMAGNVWEWTCSQPGVSSYGRVDSQADMAALGQPILKGGAWTYDRDMARCSYRSWLSPDTSGFNIGFRCVISSA